MIDKCTSPEGHEWWWNEEDDASDFPIVCGNCSQSMDGVEVLDALNAHASLTEKVEQLRERVKALEQNTSKSVLRRIDTLLERKNLQGQNQHQQE